MINQSDTIQEKFELLDSEAAVQDGISVSMNNSSGQPNNRLSINAFQRCDLSRAASAANAWNVFTRYGATPWYNVPAWSSGANGIRITEMSDAPNTAYQFLEIYADTAPGVPVEMSLFSAE